MKRPQGPVPPLGQLQESVDWFWLHLALPALCDDEVRAPMQRWEHRHVERQAAALRTLHGVWPKRAPRCSIPGWVDSAIGFQPFPVT